MDLFIPGILTFVTILKPVASAGGAHYGRPSWNGGGGHAGGGHVNPLAVGHHTGQNANWNNRGGSGHAVLSDRTDEVGCSRPRLTDAEATFEIQGCRTNSRQDWTHYCRNENLQIPCGIIGVLSCVRGRRLLRLTSRCEDDGSWKPPLVENCNDLFELLAEYKGRPADEEYKKPNPRHCPQVMLKQTPNFIITCQSESPTQAGLNDENCMNQYPDGVPSGTRIFVKCRPPSVPVSPEPSELRCQDGNWEGTVKKLICSHPAQQKTRPSPVQPQLPVPTQQPHPVQPQLPAPTQQPRPVQPQLPVPTQQQPRPVQPQPVPVPRPVQPQPVPVPRPVQPQPVPVPRPIQPQPVPIPIPQPTNSVPSGGGPITCSPLTARSGVELSCVWSGSEVGTNDCRTSRLPVGTEAKYSCAAYYEAKGQLPTAYRKCNANGAWTGSSEFSCNVECGRDNVVKIAFITHSQPTLQGQWPWHAGIFRKSPKDKESWEYICGGTLITKKALLTAGHCVTLLQTRQVVEMDDLQIHLGKYRREVTDEHVQIKSISEIIVNPNYNPYNYESDLAIIIFKTEVTIGHFVRPICFLTTSDSALEDLQLSENSIGTVVGWGYDETNKLADDLRMARLRVVGSRECSESMIGSSVTNLNARSTTFCAGYSNGTNVCNGDSGSGMYFPTKDTNTKWFIQGLVSVGIAHSDGRCNPKAYSVFTRLGRYADFVSRTLSEQDAL